MVLLDYLLELAIGITVATCTYMQWRKHINACTTKHYIIALELAQTPHVKCILYYSRWSLYIPSFSWFSAILRANTVGGSSIQSHHFKYKNQECCTQFDMHHTKGMLYNFSHLATRQTSNTEFFMQALSITLEMTEHIINLLALIHWW